MSAEASGAPERPPHNWRVHAHDEVATWLRALPADEYDVAYAAFEILAEDGPTSPRWMLRPVMGTEYPNMRELFMPPWRGHTPMRMLIATEWPDRLVLVLLARLEPSSGGEWFDDTARTLADLRYAHILTARRAE